MGGWEDGRREDDGQFTRFRLVSVPGLVCFCFGWMDGLLEALVWVVWLVWSGLVWFGWLYSRLREELLLVLFYSVCLLVRFVLYAVYCIQYSFCLVFARFLVLI